MVKLSRSERKKQARAKKDGLILKWVIIFNEGMKRGDTTRDMVIKAASDAASLIEETPQDKSLIEEAFSELLKKLFVKNSAIE